MTSIVQEVRRGLILARIRRKQSRDGVRHTVSLHRLYRNDDHWKESSRFGRDDIPLMRHVLDAAHTWICQHADSEGSGSRAS